MTGIETVMVVEDEDAIRTLMHRILTRAGYEVLEAVGPDHAIELFADAKTRAGLLLTDVVMPGMSGSSSARDCARSSPTCVCCSCRGTRAT
jgi:DNA-binding NtrC family response regulator